MDGDVTGVAISGNYAYVTMNPVIDISDPTNPGAPAYISTSITLTIIGHIC